MSSVLIEMVERRNTYYATLRQRVSRHFFSFSRGYQISKMAAVADETTENGEALVPMK
jgi:hypothetical protein